MKKWIMVLFMISVFIHTNCVTQKEKTEQLKNSIEVTNIQTKWVKKLYQPWPEKLILVPAISFQVKNISDEPIKYINFNAVFKFKNDYKNLGDAFRSTLRKESVMPGEKSKQILLKSNYGVKGKNLNSFKNNPNWGIVEVKLFAQSSGSQYVSMGKWDISRTIDFKEPEPVGDRKQLKEREEKK